MARKETLHLGTLTVASKNKLTKFRGVTARYIVDTADGQGGGTAFKNPVPTGREVTIDLNLLSTISSAGECIGRNLDVTTWSVTNLAATAYDFIGDWESGSITVQNELGDGRGGTQEWKENQIQSSSYTVKGTLLLPKDSVTGAQTLFKEAINQANLAWGTGCAIAHHTFSLSLVFSGSTFTAGAGTFLLTEAAIIAEVGAFLLIEVTFESRGEPAAATFHAEATGTTDTLRELAFETNSSSVATFVMETAATASANADLNLTGTSMLIESYACNWSKGQITEEKMVLRSVSNNVAVAFA